MNQFIFVRHGQTDANLQGLMCGGAWDLHLNENGQRQASLASQTLQKKIAPLVRIYASPMARAQATAKEISKRNPCPIISIDGLREWKIGEWERQPFESVKEQFLGSGDPESGESRKEFKQRVLDALAECNLTDEPCAIVSHGGVGMIFLEHFEIPMVRIHNCVPLKFFKNANGLWHVEEISLSDD